MKIYKIIPVLFLLFVHNAGLLADDLFETPEGTPTDYLTKVTDGTTQNTPDKTKCTWDYGTDFTYTADNAQENDNIATKAYIYGYNNEWADVETSNELVEEQKLDLDDQNNTPYVKLNPKKLKSSSKVYVLFVSYVKDGDNLITNPGFEGEWNWNSPDAVLMSGYEPVEPGSYGLMNGEGKYTIDNTLDRNNNASDYTCSQDHTSGDGKFFIANGSTRTDVDLRVWSQTLNRALLTGKYYAFSAWVMNWADDTYGNPPKLQFYTSSINNGNQPLGNKMIVKKGDQCIWKQISAIKQPETNQDITALFLLNEEKAGDGNDFGLDDLYFGEVKKIYQLYTIDIGKYSEPEVISVALCPTLLTDKTIGGVKDYIKEKLKIDRDKLEIEGKGDGDDIVDNMEFEYKETCDNNEPYVSKKIKVTYTETPKKEWQPRTNQQNNTP